MTKIIFRTPPEYQDDLAELFRIALNKDVLSGPGAMLMLKSMNERLELHFELQGIEYEHVYMSPMMIMEQLCDRRIPITPDSVCAMAEAINTAMKDGGGQCTE